jgi:hypothetical protein
LAVSIGKLFVMTTIFVLLIVAILQKVNAFTRMFNVKMVMHVLLNFVIQTLVTVNILTSVATIMMLVPRMVAIVKLDVITI